MTPNAFMTEECWLRMTPKLIEGYRSLPIICGNPDWWAVEIFDGFGAHLANYEALKLRWDAKILSVKEEGDASSINQAYDKDVAKTDKKVQRETLSVVHELEGSNNCITQWHLLICGLAAVRYTATHRHIWENSFIAVNLHPPQHMISFEEWCQ